MPLTTPDHRYIIVRGRLWRAANPNLSDEERTRLVAALMDARRAVKAARAAGNAEAAAAAHHAVDQAKHELGERGPGWWSDGAPDLNRKMVKNSPYAAWFEGIGEADDPQDSGS
ncbi:hypothetical protein ACEPPZ_11240 [Paracoccus yeei]|uniref:hypothetical protein n=1 Tax=Paracoccus yeei TaxID=147645 RepID=UPI0037D83CB4